MPAGLLSKRGLTARAAFAAEVSGVRPLKEWSGSLKSWR